MISAVYMSVIILAARQVPAQYNYGNEYSVPSHGESEYEDTYYENDKSSVYKPTGNPKTDCFIALMQATSKNHADFQKSYGKIVSSYNKIYSNLLAPYGIRGSICSGRYLYPCYYVLKALDIQRSTDLLVAISASVGNLLILYKEACQCVQAASKGDYSTDYVYDSAQCGLFNKGSKELKNLLDLQSTLQATLKEDTIKYEAMSTPEAQTKMAADADKERELEHKHELELAKAGACPAK